MIVSVLFNSNFNKLYDELNAKCFYKILNKMTINFEYKANKTSIKFIKIIHLISSLKKLKTQQKV